MIDTKELRRLAQAATPGPDGVSLNWLKLLQDFQKEANPAAIEELLDRLEVAEKERDVLRTAVRHEADCVEAAMAEIKSLRAKIEAMERQEPVGVLHVGSCYGEELEDWEFEADQRVCDRLNERHVTNPTSLKLYALPGAQPAPSVPTALLVAVADLVAQMEIVSRVGFIDTPDDKDSCAAFCVAEGTWLELMSAVESLASALAAAPEVEP